MSADNFYLIRRAPGGKFTPLMGFASDEDQPEVGAMREYQLFDTAEAAFDSVADEYAEYGHSIHPECREPATVVHEVPAVVARLLDNELAEMLVDSLRYAGVEFGDAQQEVVKRLVHDTALISARTALAELAPQDNGRT